MLTYVTPGGTHFHNDPDCPWVPRRFVDGHWQPMDPSGRVDGVTAMARLDIDLCHECCDDEHKVRDSAVVLRNLGTDITLLAHDGRCLICHRREDPDGAHVHAYTCVVPVLAAL